ncbi:MAG TPA: hypothetical protein VFG84_06730 [Gemmatimonadaceae bacterium]|nr:hypothetical protein [Gemmatimonadaceae bacterium]
MLVTDCPQIQLAPHQRSALDRVGALLDEMPVSANAIQGAALAALISLDLGAATARSRRPEG